MNHDLGKRGDPGTIVAIETVRVSLRAHPTLTVRGARGKHDRSDFLLVRLATSRGFEGYGEVSATLGWSGEDAETAEHAIRRVLAPALLGRSLLPVSGLSRSMDAAIVGQPFTKAGLEIAVWDALGQTYELSVAQLLGGPHRREVPTKLSLSGDGDELAATLEAARAIGFGAFKVKVGLGRKSDIERYRLARSLAGPDVFIGADANGGWTRLEAAATIPALVDAGAAFIEQPLQPADLEGMRALRGMGAPILADESVYSLDDVAAIVSIGAADALNIYVGMSGGMALAVQAIRTAAVFGIPSIVGSNGEMGVGAAAQLHVACAVETLGPFPSDIIGHHYYEEDILEQALDIDGTVARLPSGPGLGVRPAARFRERFA